MVVKNITPYTEYEPCDRASLVKKKTMVLLERINNSAGDSISVAEYALQVFFSHGVLEKALRKEVKEKFGFSQQKLWCWRVSVIDNSPLKYRTKFKKMFYESQERVKGEQTQGIPPYQLFVYWLISLLLVKPEGRRRRSYKEVAVILLEFLNYFTPEKFTEALDRWKAIHQPGQKQSIF
ncbi:MAG: hypothetical protein F6K53_20290 [Moorea sp. SIO4A1]|uniref:hypothetical protein n=1 Tax=Moorena sp. SIO4A1 TaxID=2607835 RepID=UPI0014508E65|nr:hypothetical protein [Moorena sp. SIO4A1]NEQ59612.1 hypothetical protein [Moorena sp. SIO4A1]